MDRWTIDLEEELRRPEWDGHAAEMNGSLGNAGLPQIDLWD
jgi:hypothetical protein